MVRSVAWGMAALMVAGAGAARAQRTQAQQDKLVHLNQVQVVGSHNSYHAGFAPSERKWMEMKNPKGLRSLDYSHKPLTVQLDGGVRQVEIDVFNDPEGGKYAHPAIVKAIAAAGLPADPEFDPEHEMDKPGFKVMHIQGVDERSTCHTFVRCLTQVRGWVKAHPEALPVFVLVETKEGAVKGMPGAPVADAFTPAIFDALDAEIRSVFSPEEMITPDEVRGSAATLNAAIRAGGWPTLEKARGKVVFLLDQKKAGPIYAQGHPSLKGRAIFINGVPGEPETAFVEENDGPREEIDGLVKQGYLVRTRTDEGTEQARTNDRTRLDRALSSGAQMLSTDYPPSEPSQWSSFVATLPGGLVARCNPVNKPEGCVSELLEPKTGLK
ncbi:MAG TPA: phosphatidylinositol-specific phospholipase C1-like protein [Acidobacteriaceae bacterium]|nr:phosphatidylinositol-specific phospholipase C1-like protein [Acidobacteriaceae bacterium]